MIKPPKLTPMEQAMNWERMSGERLSDTERTRIMNGGEFTSPGDSQTRDHFAPGSPRRVSDPSPATPLAGNAPDGAQPSQDRGGEGGLWAHLRGEWVRNPPRMIGTIALVVLLAACLMAVSGCTVPETPAPPIVAKGYLPAYPPYDIPEDVPSYTLSVGVIGATILHQGETAICH